MKLRMYVEICLVAILFLMPALLFSEIQYELSHLETTILDEPYQFVHRIGDSALRFYTLEVTSDSIFVRSFTFDEDGIVGTTQTMLQVENRYGYSLYYDNYHYFQMGEIVHVCCACDNVLLIFSFDENEYLQTYELNLTAYNNLSIWYGGLTLWDEFTFLYIADYSIYSVDIQNDVTETIDTFTEWDEITIYPLGQEYLLAGRSGFIWMLYDSDFNLLQEITEEDIPDINGAMFTRGLPAFAIGGGYIISLQNMIMYDHTDYVWVENGNELHFDSAFFDDPDGYNYRNNFVAVDDRKFLYLESLWGSNVITSRTIDNHEMEYAGYHVDGGYTLTAMMNMCIASLICTDAGNEVHVYDFVSERDFTFACPEIPVPSDVCWNSYAFDHVLMLERVPTSGSSRTIYRYELDYYYPTDDGEVTPVELALSCYPNPFNPTTTFRFTLPMDGHVEITVYNAKGQLVRRLANDRFESGESQVVWSGDDSTGITVASGVYFYRMKLDGKPFGTGKMLLMK